MKRFCVIFCVLMMMVVGCSTFGSIEMEDINDIDERLQQIALTLRVGPNKDLDTALKLLDKARLAIAAEDKIKAKEYRDAALILMDILEK